LPTTKKQAKEGERRTVASRSKRQSHLPSWGALQGQMPTAASAAAKNRKAAAGWTAKEVAVAVGLALPCSIALVLLVAVGLKANSDG
jgi:hypothetical protein